VNLVIEHTGDPVLEVVPVSTAHTITVADEKNNPVATFALLGVDSIGLVDEVQYYKRVFPPLEDEQNEPPEAVLIGPNLEERTDDVGHDV